MTGSRVSIAGPVGVVVNPIAGMGGRVGLHGTDGAVLAEAIAARAQPVAAGRAGRALSRLQALLPNLSVVTADGPMGADLIPDSWREAGWRVEVVSNPGAGATSAADTRAAVAALIDRGARLVLFAGGDGTARDVVAGASGCVSVDDGSVDDGPVARAAVPVLGIPCGVKMHSGVFATGPEAAGEAAARYLIRPGQLGRAEVVDADESGTRVFALAHVPRLTGALQAAKATTVDTSDGDLITLGRAIAAEMLPGRLYLLGPGSTVARVGEALGLSTSVVGVDAVVDGVPVACDAGEGELLALLAAHPESSLVLGVVGGQGFLFGRGNQQLSPAVLRAIGVDNIEIIAAAGKIAALAPPVLRIDVDDERVSEQLTGFRRVRTSRRRSTVLRVVA